MEAYNIINYQRQYSYYLQYLDMKSVPFNSISSQSEILDASSCIPEGDKLK